MARGWWAAPLAALALGLWPAAAGAGEQVVIGAYVNDIQALDLRTHSYAVDVYVWFRWKDEAIDPSQSIELVNGYELWGHTRTYDYPDAPRVLPSGERYQVLREQGRFSKKLLLTSYPFDSQVLIVELEEPALESDAVGFVPDTQPISLNPRLIIPGFEVGEPRLVIERHQYPTDFGDHAAGKAHFSRIRIEIPIRRPIVTYGVKFLLPILCVVLCAALMFLFSPKYVESRAGIGITSLLTIVALQITLNEDLPEIDYLVLIDKIYLVAYLFVIGGLAVVVRTSWLIQRGEEARAARIDRLSLLLLGSGFLLINALLVVPHLLS